MNHFHTPSFGDECLDLTCVDETPQQSYLQEQTRRMRTLDESQFTADDVDVCNGLINMQTTPLRSNSIQSIGSTITTPPTTLAARKQLTATTAGGDPNEPTKPLSAYSLFFRDTVSTIKQQNPNSNYYELSRIVANMWEVLDEERKIVYNNRTETARLEYIKHMNSYRQQIQQQNLEQLEQQQLFNDTNMIINGNSNTTTSPLQTKPAVFTIQRAASGDHDTSIIDSGNESTTNFMNNNFTSNSCVMPAVHNAQPPTFNDNFANESNDNVLAAAAAAAAHYQMPENQIQQQTNFNLNAAVAAAAATITETPLTTTPTHLTNIPPSQPIELLLNEAAETQTCIREGCTKRAIVNPNWDDEYCSNECVVAHCRNVFTTWVEANRNEKQQTQQQLEQQQQQQQQQVDQHQQQQAICS